MSLTLALSISGISNEDYCAYCIDTLIVTSIKHHIAVIDYATND